MSNIEKPSHYQLKGLEPYESIDVIKSVLGDKVKYFYIGNILKYIIRAEKKNGLEDYKKAEVYLNWLIEWDSLTDVEKEINRLKFRVEELEGQVKDLDEFENNLKEIKEIQEKTNKLKEKDVSNKDLFDISVRLGQLEHQLEMGE